MAKDLTSTIDWQDQADALWCHLHARRIFDVVGNTKTAEATSTDTNQEKLLENQDASVSKSVVSEPPERLTVPPPETERAADIDADDPDAKVDDDAAEQPETAAESPDRASPVRVAAPFSLPGQLAMARQLRPLARKVRKGVPELDVEASVEASAELGGGTFVPVVRPGLRRWLALDLVVDDGGFLRFWDELPHDLRELLTRPGAFRDIREWRLDASDAVGEPVLRHENGTPCSPDVLLADPQERVVLVLTDTASAAWRGPALRLLASWGERLPVALVHLLPESLWNRTALPPLERVSVSSQRLLPTLDMQTAISSVRGRPCDGRQALVSINLDERHFERWAGMLVRRGGNSVQGLLPNLNRSARMATAVAPSDTGTDVQAAVERFLDHASPMAGELAGYLAAAPLMPAVMRLVQDQFLPKSRHWHLAEVLFSGLVERSVDMPQRNGVPLYYRWRPGVRRCLLGGSLVNKSRDVWLQVGDYLSQHHPGLRGLAALRPCPDGELTGDFSNEELYFAEVNAEVWRTWSGAWKKDGEALLEKIHLEARRRLDERRTRRPSEIRKLDFSNEAGMRFIGIPAGTFLMGSPESEAGREDHETQHRVTLTETFRIAETPVTQGQWQEVMGESIRDLEKGKTWDSDEIVGEGDDFPVYFANWEDALRFCDRLTAFDRKAGTIGKDVAYTLPVEAQWEYACRAGTAGPYAGESMNELGWYSENSERSTHPVGLKAANPWGLHDMHGNVWEWCADWFEEELGGEDVSDPQGPETGGNRVVRGGSWYDPAQYCRSAFRRRYDPGDRYSSIGFRPVLASEDQRAKLGELESEPRDEAETEAEQRSAEYVEQDFESTSGQKMLCLPPGTFSMGSPKDEEGRSDDETQHEVTLSEAYWMAGTPVTQGAWQALMGSSVIDQSKMENTYGELSVNDRDHPMVFTNWKEALRYCDALTKSDRSEGKIKANQAYSIPTEAQWEYACRAGTAGPYAGESLDELGWYAENSKGSTQAVGRKADNPWGLKDMHGNVWEWCADWFAEEFGNDASKDPDGPETGEDRVIRGGCWGYPARHCRSAFRHGSIPGLRYDFIGFRPVLVSEDQRAKLGELESEPRDEAETEAEQRSPAFVPVKAGTFVMGSQADEEGREQGIAKETPHAVMLTRDFEMAQTPVTQSQWEKVTGENSSHFTESGDDAPVEQVSWEDAVAYCKKLTELNDDGWVYRLPTEAEWENACRAGTTGPYNVDQASLQDLGWFSKNSGNKTHPVKKKRPNALGLHDMHGNVWEWCADWFAEELGRDDIKDPQGPETGELRVIRGGCWDYPAQGCRSAFRGRDLPGYRNYDIGVRPVRTLAKLGELESEPRDEAETEAEQRSRPNGLGMQMIEIPGGRFVMGSPEDEEGRESNDYCGKETSHLVKISRAFSIAKTPVTQGQWSSLMKTSVSEQKAKAKGNRFGEVTGEDDAHPMYFVTWEEALAFCDALSESERLLGRIGEEEAYSLPTEAQWEYACRAGTKGPFAGEPLDELGWYSKNSERSTQGVGQKAENPWGLQDMHGNVYEWCADWFAEELGSGSVSDPEGPETGVPRVIRGGSWLLPAQYCRSASRGRYDPGSRINDIGFRPVLTTTEQRAKLGELPKESKPELRHEAEAKIRRAGDKVSGPNGMTFVQVRRGTFMMGSPEAEEGRFDWETQHEVTLSEDFEIAETPVTQQQWKAVMGANPSHFSKWIGGRDLPVEQVGWEDAMAFCAKLSEGDTEWNYHLPTEAQWEYACRAGTEGPYNVDGAELVELSWFSKNSGNKTRVVKKKRPNALGLYDMHGNVWEWCADWFAEELGSDASKDPVGPETGENRVVRGGSWYSPAQYCRSAYRSRDNPGYRDYGIGFRPVRTRKKQ